MYLAAEVDGDESRALQLKYDFIGGLHFLGQQPQIPEGPVAHLNISQGRETTRQPLRLPFRRSGRRIDLRLAQIVGERRPYDPADPAGAEKGYVADDAGQAPRAQVDQCARPGLRMRSRSSRARESSASPARNE